MILIRPKNQCLFTKPICFIDLVTPLLVSTKILEQYRISRLAELFSNIVFRLEISFFENENIAMKNDLDRKGVQGQQKKIGSLVLTETRNFFLHLDSFF